MREIRPKMPKKHEECSKNECFAANKNWSGLKTRFNQRLLSNVVHGSILSGIRASSKPGAVHIYQQTFIDTYSKVVHCKLYTTKTPITAADLLNDKVLPFYTSHDLPMLRILTDRGTEYCGKVEQHDFQLYLAINDIDHTKTKAMSPQTNGICERFHKTILQEFYQVTFRKKLYADMGTLQKDLDDWLDYYNNERTHQGKVCNGRTPMETLLSGKLIWDGKNLNQI